MAKTMTLRLDDEQAATLELVARANNKTLTEVVRSAIDDHIDACRADTEFMERIRQQRERDQALYDRLGS